MSHETRCMILNPCFVVRKYDFSCERDNGSRRQTIHRKNIHIKILTCDKSPPSGTSHVVIPHDLKALVSVVERVSRGDDTQLEPKL